MDNLPAHKLSAIESMIESVGFDRELSRTVQELCVYPLTLLILIRLKCGGRSLNLFDDFQDDGLII